MLFGPILLLGACGGGGGAGPSNPNAPAIANLRVSYTPSNPLEGAPVQIAFFVDVVDPDGDWVNGTCQFTTADQIALPIAVGPGVPANATSGTATCLLIETFQNEWIRVDLTVVDRAGNQSNILSYNLYQ